MGGFMGLLGLVVFVFIVYLAYKQVMFIIKSIPLYEEMVLNLKKINGDVEEIKLSLKQKN